MQGIGAISASQFPPIAAGGAADAPAVAPQNNPAEGMHPLIQQRQHTLSQQNHDVGSLKGIDALLCAPLGMTGRELRQWWAKTITEFVKQDLKAILQ